MSIGDTLKGIFDTLGEDALAAAEAPLRTALTSIQANPSVENIAAQGAALAVSLPAALPTLGSTAAQQLATDGLALLDGLKGGPS
jgi:hypothetical protein